MIKPLFANSAHVFAPEKFVLSGGNWNRVKLQVRYGFLDHPLHGPTLIDTGYSHHVTEGEGRSWFLSTYCKLLRPRLAKPCSEFLAACGYGADDISNVIITHFHADHISALRDFRKARFLVSANAWKGCIQASRFANIRHGIFTELLPEDFSERMTAFESFPIIALPHLGNGHDLFGDGSVVSVALPGHAEGHCGIWFGAMDEPVLYATDAEWMRPAITHDRTPGFPATLIATDRQAGIRSSKRVKAHSGEADFLLCHQPERHRLDLEEG